MGGRQPSPSGNQSASIVAQASNSLPRSAEFPNTGTVATIGRYGRRVISQIKLWSRSRHSAVRAPNLHRKLLILLIGIQLGANWAEAEGAGVSAKHKLCAYDWSNKGVCNLPHKVSFRPIMSRKSNAQLGRFQLCTKRASKRFAQLEFGLIKFYQLGALQLAQFQLCTNCAKCTHGRLPMGRQDALPYGRHRRFRFAYIGARTHTATKKKMARVVPAMPKYYTNRRCHYRVKDCAAHA